MCDSIEKWTFWFGCDKYYMNTCCGLALNCLKLCTDPNVVNLGESDFDKN